jgi:hypothetical protein
VQSVAYETGTKDREPAPRTKYASLVEVTPSHAAHVTDDGIAAWKRHASENRPSLRTLSPRDIVRFLRARLLRGCSNCIEAVPEDRRAVSDPQALNCTVQLERINTRTVRDQTTGNIDLTGGAAGFDAERNG